MSLPDNQHIIQATAFVDRLTEAQVNNIATALTTGALPLTASALQLRQVISLSGPESASLVTLLRQWNTAGASAETLAAVLLAARAASIRTAAEHPQVHLVWTGPVDAVVPARTTLNVLLDLIEAAQSEIIIVGYTLTGAASTLLNHLGIAHRRGVRVVLIGNRLEQRLSLIHQHWPAGLRMPEMYTRPLSSSDPQSALHAKLAIVDHQRMLVTSANLTYHGLTGNIEVGVLVEGATAREVVDLLNKLIAEAVLMPVSSGVKEDV